MRVGSYNVLIPRDDRPNKAQESWESRKASVVETIDSSFDLVGLQECSTTPAHGQSSYLVEELTARGWTGYFPWESKLFADQFSERLPIFWRPELFTLLEAGQLLLSGWNQAELAEVPTLEARYASFVKLQTAVGGTLWFYTLHLQHETSHASEREIILAREKREQGQAVVAAHIEAHRSPGATVILGGDFNTPEIAPSLGAQGGLRNIRNCAERVRDWHRNSFHDWEHPEHSEHIDHVLLSSPLRVLEAAIVQSNASDHHPVRAVLAD